MANEQINNTEATTKKKKWMVINQSKDTRPEVQNYCGYEELPPIPISFPNKGAIGKTGTWRVYRPIIDQKKCTKCNTCYIYCPEGTIQFDDSQQCLLIDYDYCKGCGICAKVCNVKAIELKLEEK